MTGVEQKPKHSTRHAEAPVQSKKKEVKQDTIEFVGGKANPRQFIHHRSLGSQQKHIS
jgi:hypothetical protein